MSALYSEGWKRGGNEIGTELERGAQESGERDSLGVPWILEPGGPVRVPLYHTRPIQHGLRECQIV